MDLTYLYCPYDVWNIFVLFIYSKLLISPKKSQTHQRQITQKCNCLYFFLWNISRKIRFFWLFLLVIWMKINGKTEFPISSFSVRTQSVWNVEINYVFCFFKLSSHLVSTHHHHHSAHTDEVPGIPVFVVYFKASTIAYYSLSIVAIVY